MQPAVLLLTALALSSCSSGTVRRDATETSSAPSAPDLSFKHADHDASGALSLEEARDALDAHFAALDRDGDAQLSLKKEWNPPAAAKCRPAAADSLSIYEYNALVHCYFQASAAKGKLSRKAFEELVAAFRTAQP